MQLPIIYGIVKGSRDNCIGSVTMQETVTDSRDTYKEITFSFNGTLPMSETYKYVSTNYVHDGIKMTEYENEPFVVGDYDNNQVEFLHMSHERWYTASPYPSTSKNRLDKNRIFGYSPGRDSESSQWYCDFAYS